MKVITIKDCPLCGAEVYKIRYTTDEEGQTKLNCMCYDCHAEYTVYGDKRIYPFAGEWMETGRDADEIWNERYWEQQDSEVPYKTREELEKAGEW